MELKLDKKFIDEAVQKADEEIKRNVILIPEGMTNGEVIQALFPNIKLIEKVDTTRKYALMDKSVKALLFLKTTDRWWNASYKADMRGNDDEQT